ncbi:MAG: hypothetical protein H6636_02985 [Anaerolineales bacterium]|nr:hypothetical protein [Anaerolineales bacterium]
MPFFDDSGLRPEEEHSPIGRAFALIGDQLERLVLLNIVWALQLVPLIVSWAFPQIPAVLRVALTLYTIFALIPATGMLFGVLHETSNGVPLDFDLMRAALKEQFVPSLVKLLPLWSLFGWLALGASAAAARGWLLFDALARLLILLLAVVGLYWGPVMIAEPDQSAVGIFRQSVHLFLRKPAPTLGTGLVCLAAALLGTVSVAGLFLIVPVAVGLMQIQLLRAHN